MLHLIEAAGWPIWFLILASVACVALVIERGLALRRAKILPAGLLDELAGLRGAVPVTPELITRLAASSPLGRILAAGLRHEAAGRARMKEAMEDAGRGVAHELERFLSGLGTIATVAPLMGLFGTVVGMIEIFGAQAPGGTNPQQLAHGISVALYNTALGILIAIPALIAYRHFRARVDDYLAEMEQQALRLLDLIEPAMLRPMAPMAGSTAPVGAPAVGMPAAEPRKPVRRTTRPPADTAKAEQAKAGPGA